MTIRIEEIENRAKTKNDAYEAIQHNVDNLSKLVSSQKIVEDLKF